MYRICLEYSSYTVLHSPKAKHNKQKYREKLSQNFYKPPKFCRIFKRKKNYEKIQKKKEKHN